MVLLFLCLCQFYHFLVPYTSMHISLKDDLAVWQKCFYFQLGQDAFRVDYFCLYIARDVVFCNISSIRCFH